MTNYHNIKTGEPAEFISIDSNDIVKVKIAGELMLIPWHEFVKDLLLQIRQSPPATKTRNIIHDQTT